MIKKYLKNDTKENLKFFSDIKILPEYSNLSKELSIQYHNFTYSSFYHNLKNISERLKKGNTFNLLSISPYPETKVQNKFDIEKMKRAIEKMKEEEINNQNRKKHPYTERNKDSFSFSLYENKKRIREEIKKKREHEKKLVSPGLCRYNPKYKSIEKHTRRVIFSFNNFKKFNTTYNHKLMIKKKKIKEEDNIIKTKIENMKKKLDRLNFKIKNESREKKEKREKREKKITKTESIENNKGNDIIPKLFQNTEINKKSRNKENNDFKNNHCFKFETYTSRIPLLNKTTYDGDSIFRMTSSTSVNNTKRNIIIIKNKKKIIKRNYVEEIIKNKKFIPSIGFYRPNFSSVTPKTIDIYFNGKKDKKNNMKHFKLKKILGNYKVGEEYELFQFLNFKKNKIINKDVN